MYHALPPRPARLAAGVAVAATLLGTLSAAPAGAATAPGTAFPQVTGLSSHRGTTECGASVTITGTNFAAVTGVRFGSVGVGYQVLSPERILAYVGAHARAKVAVRVMTVAGSSTAGAQASYAWVHQAPNIHTTKLNCGMTAAQEMASAAKFRRTARQHVVAPVKRSAHWTPAMGQNAVRRAQAWAGVPYSWAGGNSSGPTYGVNSGGAGRWDGRIWGFDCSGLALYSWAPYKSMAHFAATQYRQAGRFHPGPNELMPGDLVFYSGTGTAGGIDHVQIYVGGGQIVQAPQSGYPVGAAGLYPGAHAYFAATRPLTSGKQGPAPTLTRLSATSGAAGDTTTLIAYGTNLRNVSTVLVGGVRTYAFTSLSSGRLKITLPAHAAGNVAIRIGGAWGVSNTLRFSYLGAPTVTGVSPNQGPAGTTQDVTITGTGFTGATAVTVGGNPATYTVGSATTIQATLPALPAGTYPIAVTTAYGTSTGWASFSYLAATGGTAPTAPSRRGRGGAGPYGGGS